MCVCVCTCMHIVWRAAQSSCPTTLVMLVMLPAVARNQSQVLQAGTVERESGGGNGHALGGKGGGQGMRGVGGSWRGCLRASASGTSIFGLPLLLLLCWGGGGVTPCCRRRYSPRRWPTCRLRSAFPSTIYVSSCCYNMCVFMLVLCMLPHALLYMCPDTRRIKWPRRWRTYRLICACPQGLVLLDIIYVCSY